MVYLGNRKTRHQFLRLLRLIFLDKLKAAEKIKKLKNEYDLALTPDMEEELTKMGSLAEGIAERAKTEGYNTGRTEGYNTGRTEGYNTGRTEGYNTGRTEGIDSALVSSIRNLMKKLNWTAQQAMDALMIPAEKQKRYAALI